MRSNGAVAEGLLPLDDGFAGDIFAGMNKSELFIEKSSPYASDNVQLVQESLKPYMIKEPPLGWEFTAGNRVRTYARHLPTGAILLDGTVTINEYGFRETRGHADSDERPMPIKF